MFRLPELLEKASDRIFVVEGEKCACVLATLGVLVTTSAHGGKSADKTDWGPLAGREVIILPDNDGEGRCYAQTVTGIVSRLSPPAMVKILELSGLPEKGDCVDWLDTCDVQTPEDIRAELFNLVDRTEVISQKIQPRPLAQLLDSICAFLQRYVVFQHPEQPIAIAPLGSSYMGARCARVHCLPARWFTGKTVR